MTDLATDDLATLARAMGYSVTLDDSGGYGVVRVLASMQFDDGKGFQCVFRPHDDSAQAWEVMAWLMRHQDFYGIDPQSITLAEDDNDCGYDYIAHDGTAAGIRRAVVEAAIRVAKG